MQAQEEYGEDDWWDDGYCGHQDFGVCTPSVYVRYFLERGLSFRRKDIVYFIVLVPQPYAYWFGCTSNVLEIFGEVGYELLLF
tara:strand:+ start:234 stop:482 length:249 start_codon:yes stop_codon:yes gene_type:complete